MRTQRAERGERIGFQWGRVIPMSFRNPTFVRFIVGRVYRLPSNDLRPPTRRLRAIQKSKNKLLLVLDRWLHYGNSCSIFFLKGGKKLPKGASVWPRVGKNCCAREIGTGRDRSPMQYLVNCLGPSSLIRVHSRRFAGPIPPLRGSATSCENPVLLWPTRASAFPWRVFRLTRHRRRLRRFRR